MRETTYLGLIRDMTSPISKVNVVATLLQEAFQAGGHGIDTLGFNNIDDALLRLPSPILRPKKMQ